MSVFLVNDKREAYTFWIARHDISIRLLIVSVFFIWVVGGRAYSVVDIGWGEWGSHLRPLFLVLSRGPLLKMVCLVLGNLVAFWNGPLVSTTVEVITKSGYFTFDRILPLQSILPFNVCVSSKLAYLLQCSLHCFGVADSDANYE